MRMAAKKQTTTTGALPPTGVGAGFNSLGGGPIGHHDYSKGKQKKTTSKTQKMRAKKEKK